MKIIVIRLIIFPRLESRSLVACTYIVEYFSVGKASRMIVVKRSGNFFTPITEFVAYLKKNSEKHIRIGIRPHHTVI